MSFLKKLLQLLGILTIPLTVAAANLENNAAKEAATAANIAVETSMKQEGVKLDYSPESLKKADSLLLKYKAEGATPDKAEGMIFVFGCYLGEVMIRNGKGRWGYASEVIEGAESKALVVIDEKGNLWNPLGKVTKLLLNGEEDNLPLFYQVFHEKTH